MSRNSAVNGNTQNIDKQLAETVVQMVTHKRYIDNKYIIEIEKYSTIRN